MPLPQAPPPPDSIDLRTLIPKALKAGALDFAALPDRYLHWDELRHREPPAGLSREEFWHTLKLKRRGLLNEFPLKDVRGRPFYYSLADPAPELLHRIDHGGGGTLEAPGEITNPETRDRYIVSSLMEEATRSSQIEGASTTRQAAKDMIRSGRPPRNRSERMVLNNFLAMERIRDLRQDDLTPEIVLDLHRVLTDGTLDDPEMAGRFRKPDQRILVTDHHGEILHVPPPTGQLDARLRAMCDFANGKASRGFLHPVIKAILLHFWLAYDHPFVDGNGRCARALFNWSMLRQGYWLFEFISISRAVHGSLGRYQRAFLYTETDDNDLTYFIHYHLEVIRKAIEELHRYLRRKAAEVARVERLMRSSYLLNHRQRAIVSHALRHPGHHYTIASHRRSHNVVYQTARTDLMGLVEKGLFQVSKRGKTQYYLARERLEKRLGSLR